MILCSPLHVRSLTFIFSSPAPARYKEMLKSFKYIMPTWSEQELMSGSVADISQWYSISSDSEVCRDTCYMDLLLRI